MTGIKKTPLYQQHLASGARMINFFGWELPLEYSGSLAEAKATRKACGIFDASHMGELEISGPGAFNFLQQLLSNDLSLVSVANMQYNLLLNSSGGVVDDCMVYHLGDKFLCVVNASNKDKVIDWLRQHQPPEVNIVDKSNELALISLQGPLAEKIVARVFGPKLKELAYLSFTQGYLKNKSYLASRSGYTGEDGFEIYVSWFEAAYWWNKFLTVGEDREIFPCGLGARDILRIEAGYPLYGHELDDNINPYQASLGWALKLNKDLIAKEELAKIKQSGPDQKRIGFIMRDSGVPRQGYPVYLNTQLIGRVTSGTFSPNLGKFIGMAYIDLKHSQTETAIDIQIRGKLYKAEVKNYPFIKTRVKGNRGGVKV